MKKIAIITLHSPMNCGSVLQGFALNYYINNHLGLCSYIIDYNPSYFENEGNTIRNLLRRVLFSRQYRSRKEKFRSFVETNDVLSKNNYKTFKELEEHSPEADCFVVGSDQLWNPYFKCGNDDAFFLKFVKNGSKISYATSLGSKHHGDEELKHIADKFSDFSFVSVRERCSADQFKALGHSRVECVCDPTLLLSRVDYDRIAVDYSHLGKFVAVYLVEESDLLNKVLNFYRSKGFKIVGVGGYRKKYDCDLHIQDAGPADFLGLIKYASVVVATSFHATVFSLINEKEFFIIPPKVNTARIEELLGLVGCEKRIITSYEEFIDAERQSLDYQKISKKLTAHIDFSKKWLSKALQNLLEKDEE